MSSEDFLDVEMADYSVICCSCKINRISDHSDVPDCCIKCSREICDLCSCKGLICIDCQAQPIANQERRCMPAEFYLFRQQVAMLIKGMPPRRKLIRDMPKDDDEEKKEDNNKKPVTIVNPIAVVGETRRIGRLTITTPAVHTQTKPSPPPESIIVRCNGCRSVCPYYPLSRKGGKGYWKCPQKNGPSDNHHTFIRESAVK